MRTSSGWRRQQRQQQQQQRKDKPPVAFTPSLNLCLPRPAAQHLAPALGVEPDQDTLSAAEARLGHEPMFCE